MKRSAVAKKMSKAGVGYNRRDAVSHRKYSRKASLKRYKRTGVFRTVSGGSGHEAGRKWGDAKGIDPDSPQWRYSKNSPSFDEGVKLSKDARKPHRAAAVEKKLLDIAKKKL